MDTRDVRFALEDGVAVVTLDRPEQRNTFTGRMGRELGAAYRRCDEDDAVRAVVVTGAGEAFCAGADMAAAEETFASPADDTGFSASPVAFPAWRVRKPVIAAMNGHAIGIGLTLALHTDIRLAAEDAKYGVVQVRRGVMPDCAAHWTLPRLIGLAKAADLLLTGRLVTGREAAELGIASRALAAADVLPTALELAREIAVHTAPLSVGLTKRLLWESPMLTRAEVERRETLLHHHLMARSDAVEGVMAFLERREPRWHQSPTKDWPDTWPGDDPEEA